MSADEHKALGNEAFKAQDFEGAAKHFSDAIALDASNHVLYSNRSAARASLGQFEDALEDAAKCVELNPTWAKGYSRKGAALVGLKRHDEAVAAYEEGLKHDPENATLKAGLEDAKHARDGGGGDDGLGGLGNMFADPNLFAKIMANPQTAPFLQQPDFVAKINALQRDPSSLNAHLQDPRVMQVVGMLMGINVQMGPGGESGAEASAAPPPKEPEPEPEPEPADEDLSPEEREARERRKEADAAKAQGNEAYKAKRFEEAIAHYERAIALVPTEMTYLTNLAAVHFEQKDYEKTLEACAKAIEVGRETRADYRNMAKAYARKGNALQRLDDLPGAIKAFEDSLLEHRTEEVYKRLKAAQKLLQEREELAYQDPDKAKAAREQGNALFKEGKYPEAIEAYTEAMRRDPKDHVPYSNRAACYQKLMEWPMALKDCDKCIEMCPAFIKAWTRKGGLHFHLKEYHKALDAYNKALELDGESAEAKDGVERTLTAIQAGSEGEDQQQRAQRAMADPEIQAILNDQTIRKVLGEMQDDPASANKFLKDPDIKRKIEKLIAAGVLQVK